MAATASGWITLPADVRDLIFGTVALREVLPLRLVCKSWRDGASSLRLGYLCPDTMTGKKLDGLVKLFPKLSILMMDQCAKLTNADLVSLSALSDLRQLHLSLPHLSVVTSLRNVVNSLRSLFVRSASAPRGKELAVVSTFRNLVDVSFGRLALSDGLAVTAQLPHLTSLKMYGLVLEDCADGVVAQRVRHLPPTLRKIVLAGGIRLSRDDMDALCLSLPRLETFELNTIGTPPGQHANLSPPSPEGARHLTALLDLSVPVSLVATEMTAFSSQLTRLAETGPPDQVSMELLHKLAASCPRLRVLQVDPQPLSIEFLEAMLRFSELRKLNIGGCEAGYHQVSGQPSNQVISVLTRLKRLNTLVLMHLKFGADAFMPIIAGLSSLVDLQIRECVCSSASLASLSSLQHLVSLRLDQMHVEDCALEAIIRSNTALTRLHVPDSQISALSSVSQLKGLIDLNLNNCKLIDDAAIAALSSLHHLRCISIVGTAVTGVGFADFQSLSSLTALHFMPPSKAGSLCVTTEGAKCLAQFPNVTAMNVTVPLADDIFRAFFSRGKYRSATIWHMKLSQVPLLLQCTTLRSLFLHSPEDAIYTGNAADLIVAAIPQLENFHIRSPLGSRVVRGNEALPTVTPPKPAPPKAPPKLVAPRLPPLPHP